MNGKGRARHAFAPLAVCAGLALLLLIFGSASTWRFWAVAAVVGVLLARTLSELRQARSALVIDDAGATSFGRTVTFAGARLEVRISGGGDEGRAYAVVLSGASTEGPAERIELGASLVGFDDAVQALASRVREEDITVSAPGEPDVRGARRAQVLSKMTVPRQQARAVG